MFSSGTKMEPFLDSSSPFPLSFVAVFLVVDFVVVSLERADDADVARLLPYFRL